MAATKRDRSKSKGELNEDSPKEETHVNRRRRTDKAPLSRYHRKSSCDLDGPSPETRSSRRSLPVCESKGEYAVKKESDPPAHRESPRKERSPVEVIVDKPCLDFVDKTLETPRSKRSSLKKYEQANSDIYTHIEEPELGQPVKPEDDFYRSLLIAQSSKSSKRKTNSVRFKLDLDEASDEGIGESDIDWRKRKQYADSVFSDTDQSLTSSHCRGIIRNSGSVSDRTGYRRPEVEYVEMENGGSKTWRYSIEDSRGIAPDEIDVIDISKNNSYADDNVCGDADKSGSKVGKYPQEPRKTREIKPPEATDESDWVSLPSLVFREDSDVVPTKANRRHNSDRRRRRKRRSERVMEKPRIEKLLSNMSEEAKLAIDAMLSEMEGDKQGPKKTFDRNTARVKRSEKLSIKENSGNDSFDDGMDSGFQDTDVSNNLNSKSSSSDDVQKYGFSDKSQIGIHTAERNTKKENSHYNDYSRHGSRFRSKTARSRTPTKFPMINSEFDSYAFDDGFTESSVPSRQNIPGLGTYRFPRMREKTFKITPPGYDSRYAEIARYEAPPDDLDPAIAAKAKEKCNQWLDQQYLPSLS